MRIKQDDLKDKLLGRATSAPSDTQLNVNGILNTLRQASTLTNSGAMTTSFLKQTDDSNSGQDTAILLKGNRRLITGITIECGMITRGGRRILPYRNINDETGDVTRTLKLMLVARISQRATDINSNVNVNILTTLTRRILRQAIKLRMIR